MKLPHYHEDQKKLHVGTAAKRSYFVPASNRILAGLPRDVSDRYTDLDGDWAFSYHENDLDLPENFYAADFDVNLFDSIPVPSVWQNFGYGSHNYINTRFPIPYDPPYVPADNACGIYIRDFELAADNMDHTLVFEGVDSCFYVWVNGVFTGYSQTSHNMSEFDISKNAHPGINRLAVLVYRYCDGTYLEDQDKLRMSGIFRDVYVLARPKKRVEDFTVRESFSADMKKAALSFSCKVKGKCLPTVTLMDGPELIAQMKGTDGSLHVDEPVLWSAENPFLYDLFIETENEVILKKIGFRKIEVKNRTVLINNQKIKFKGVNRHDSSPFNGYAVTFDEMYQDITMMKAHNFNAIRTSHYPNSPLFTELCDSIGMYVIGESDVEIHGPVNVYGGNDYRMFGMLADDPEWADAIFDRIESNVVRDKNVTSVVIWSLGNEAGYGCGFEKSAAWIRQYDPTRLVHYESAMHGKIYDPSLLDPKPLFEYRHTERPDGKYDYDSLDMYSRMYPSIDEMEDYRKNGDKPMILCEYTHAMGNGPGDVEDYWQEIYSSDVFCGAFVWEWCDHSVYMGLTPDGRDKFFYGGDWNDRYNDGNFCMDGLVYPDRRPHTGLLEVKNVIRPVRLVSAKGNTFTFRNTLDFTDLKDHVEIGYRILTDGKESASGRLKVSCRPHRTVKITLPEEIPAAPRTSLLFTYINVNENRADYMPEEMGFDQYLVPAAEPQIWESCETPAFTENGEFVIIKGSSFRYVYSKRLAAFTDLVKDQVSFLEQPMKINIWRAPTDNDRSIRLEWESHLYNDIRLRTKKCSVSEKNGFAVLRTTVTVGAVTVAPILTADITYEISGDGRIRIDMKGEKDVRMPFLPRFGLRMFEDPDFEQVSYYGYGPYESYIDKRRASYLGRFEDTVTAMHEDYLKPQENGSHYGCRDLVLTSKRGGKIRVTGSDFSFNASHYTEEELTEKRHSFELEKSGYTVLCIDGRQSGIGTNSCGPELAPKYRLGNHLRMQVTLEFAAE